jgi:hypothetical protein
MADAASSAHSSPGPGFHTPRRWCAGALVNGHDEGAVRGPRSGGSSRANSEAHAQASPQRAASSDDPRSEASSSALQRAQSDAPASEASSSAVGHPSEPASVETLRKLCKCSGQCGNPRCLRIMRASKSPGKDGSLPAFSGICSNAKMRGQMYCAECICDGWDEGVQCCKARFRHFNKRWCSFHALRREATAGKTYANSAGVWPYGRGWPLPLKVVARTQFLLEKLDPSDLTAFVDFVVLLAAPVPGKRIATDILVAAFLAGCLKWPTLVVPEGLRLQRVPIFTSSVDFSLRICVQVSRGRAVGHTEAGWIRSYWHASRMPSSPMNFVGNWARQVSIL